jgi:hypothetical protein
MQYSNPVAIKAASKEDHQGTWTCTAENAYGESDKKSVEILIATKTSIRSISEPLVQAHISETLTLNCDVDVDENLKDSVRTIWSKNGKVIENFEEIIFTENVSDTSVAGVYECR